MDAVKNSWVEDLVFSENCNCSPSGDYWYCFWPQHLSLWWAVPHPTKKAGLVGFRYLNPTYNRTTI